MGEPAAEQEQQPMRSSRSQRGRREHSIVLTHEEGTGHRYSGSEDGVTRRGGAVGGTGRWRHDTNARHRREQREHPVRSRACDDRSRDGGRLHAKLDRADNTKQMSRGD